MRTALVAGAVFAAALSAAGCSGGGADAPVVVQTSTLVPAKTPTSMPTESPAPSVTVSTDPTKSVQPVTAGAFCSSSGARGVSKSGKTMTCKAASDGRLRWITDKS